MEKEGTIGGYGVLDVSQSSSMTEEVEQTSENNQGGNKTNIAHLLIEENDDELTTTGNNDNRGGEHEIPATLESCQSEDVEIVGSDPEVTMMTTNGEDQLSYIHRSPQHQLVGQPANTLDKSNMLPMYSSSNTSLNDKKRQRQRITTPHSSRSAHGRKRHDRSSRKSVPAEGVSSFCNQSEIATSSGWFSPTSSHLDTRTNTLPSLHHLHRIYSSELSAMKNTPPVTSTATTSSMTPFELRVPSGFNDFRFCDSASSLLHSNGCVYFAHGFSIYEYPIYQKRSPTGLPQGVRRVADLPLPKPSASGIRSFIWINQIVASPASQCLHVIANSKSDDEQDRRVTCVFRVGFDGSVFPVTIPDECRQSSSQLPSSVCSLSSADSGRLVISSNDVWFSGAPPPLWVCDSGLYRWKRVMSLKSTALHNINSNATHTTDHPMVSNTGGWAGSSRIDDRSLSQSSSIVSSAVEHLGDQYSTIIPMKEGLIELHDTFVDGSLLILVLRTSMNRTQAHPCLLRADITFDPSTSTHSLNCTPVFSSDHFSQLPEIRDWQMFKVDPSTMGSIYASFVVESNDLSLTPSHTTSPCSNRIDPQRPTHSVMRFPLWNQLPYQLDGATKILSEGDREYHITNISGFWCLGFGRLISGKCEAVTSSNTSGSLKKEKRRLTIDCHVLPEVPLRESFEFPEVMLQDSHGDVRLECFPLESISNQIDHPFIESSLPSHYAVLRWRSKELHSLMNRKREQLENQHSTSSSSMLLSDPTLFSLIRLSVPCSKSTLSLFRQYLYTQSLFPLIDDHNQHNTSTNNSLHINIAELLILSIRFNLNTLTKRMEEFLLRQINPETVLDIYEILQWGMAYLDCERVSEEDFLKLAFLRKVATNMIISYLGLLPSKRISLFFNDIIKGGSLREMLYERYESRRDVRQHWRDVASNPQNAERVVSQLFSELQQLRINENKDEADSLSLVH